MYGKVDHLGVVPTEITVATETSIKAAFYDANNIVVKNEQLYNGGSRLNNLDFDITTSQGYTTANGKLHLYEVGNTATATLELHSNTFDANGNEVGNIKNTATITAVAAATITDQSFSTKIGNSGSSYDTVKESVVAQGDSSKSAYIRIKLSDGTTSDNLSAYKLESSDLNVLILNSVTGPTNGEVALKPVLPGSCYIIVRDAKNNVVATLPVTVKAARYAARLSLSKYAATLSNKVYDVNTGAFVADTATATGVAASKMISINDVSTGNRMAAKTYALTATFTCEADDVNPSVVKTITRNFRKMNNT